MNQKRTYNFSAGPATLPLAVLEQAQAELIHWKNGMGPMEVSHRGSEFKEVIDETEADVRTLLNVPDNYQILFLQGGATGQFAFIPLNLLAGNQHADYVRTGHWSHKAIQEANKYCSVNIVADTKEQGYNHIPDFSTWQCDPKAAYLHYATNETIHGVQFHEVPTVVHAPLVADMSSDIFSRPLDINQFGLIYAGAQKNLGPAGLTLVIVREDLMGKAHPLTPSAFDYQIQAKQRSCFNTAPTFTWYMIGLVLKWVKAQGGVSAMFAQNQAKAALLYDLIDKSDFYLNHVNPKDRSYMNVAFQLKRHELLETFLTHAQQEGLVNLKGHRAVGGVRASIYNAMPMEGVKSLVNFMQHFEETHA